MEERRIDTASLFDLTGRVALVTGASSGIGQRMARVLAAAGAGVVVAARRMDALDELAGELGDSCLAVRTDLTSGDERRRLTELAVERYGQIDVLVNNAGIVEVSAAEDEDLEAFERVVGLNLSAQFALTQLVARRMLSGRGGSIVNVASVLGLVGSGQLPLASYAASKGGLINLTRELAAQWASRGVRVNALAPGFFHSEMTAAMLASESGQRFVARRTPMGRPGEPHELDGALLFLASPASSYVTGHVLAVDGGWTAI